MTRCNQLTSEDKKLRTTLGTEKRAIQQLGKIIRMVVLPACLLACTWLIIAMLGMRHQKLTQ
jgi:hypothetical protein